MHTYRHSHRTITGMVITVITFGVIVLAPRGAESSIGHVTLLHTRARKPKLLSD